MAICNACPRGCKIDRRKTVGYCGTGEDIKIARVGLHKWEEPCICYGEGSGTIFFSGCNLKCVYCQNFEISHQYNGVIVDRTKLCEEILHLQELGACNINLVTPSHYTEEIKKVLPSFLGKQKQDERKAFMRKKNFKGRCEKRTISKCE